MITRENAGEKLLDYRRDNNITQIEISKSAKISIPTILGMESGSITPQTMTIHKLKAYFMSVGIQ